MHQACVSNPCSSYWLTGSSAQSIHCCCTAVAPAGSYMDKGIGKLCPKGTYSTDLNSLPACTACNLGVTTAAEGSTSPNQCILAKPGFYMINTTAAALCPVNTYNDGELASNTTCTPCPNEMKTKAEGADGVALCLAPPGYELTAAAAAVDGPITECEKNYYKVDWNRNLCQYVSTSPLWFRCGIALRAQQYC